MLLVERVLERSPAGVTCRGRIPPDCPFALGGWAPALLAIELAAQTAAVSEALSRPAWAPGPRMGYLVSVRAALFAVHQLPVDEPLVAHVCSAGQALPLALYAARVEHDGRELMRATLGAYLPTSSILGAP